MFERDGSELHHLSGHLKNLYMPLGSGAIAGSSLPLDATETSAYLTALRAKPNPRVGPVPWEDWLERHREDRHMLPVPTSAIEHTASRDHALRFVYACAMTAMHLSRWAEQWIIYSSAEFGFIKTADKYTTGSSMMPQKRNPDMLELIRGRCGNVYGNLVALLTICKGLPIGYNRDLQEEKRHVFAAYDTVSSCLTMAAAIVNSTDFVKDKCEAACEGGFMDATSLAEYLVVKGVPFRTAHQIVGGLVAKCESEGKTKLEDLTLSEFQAASDVIEQDVFDALGARNVVARYQSAGAAGGEPLKKQLAEWKQRLGL
jgi:argininosuccinate lyase